MSKLMPPSLSGPAPAGVVAGLGLKLELDTPEEELGAMPGNKLASPGIVGTAPGSNAAGLIIRLA